MNEVYEGLRACPFCGSQADVKNTIPITHEKREAYGYGGYFVMCRVCLTSGNNYPTEMKAIEAWNRRATNESKHV